MRIVTLVAVTACGARATPATHVEIAPLPSVALHEEETGTIEDSVCKPQALVAVGVDSSEHLDGAQLRAVLESARDFAQRCCNGDESGDAIVSVTVSPEGYTTAVAIEPSNLAGGATGACLYASFHRVTTKSFHGDAMTITVPVHVRP